jgi:hypothetical protein
LLANHAGVARAQPTIELALGWISENTRPPSRPYLPDRLVASKNCIDAFIALWKERCRLRTFYLANGL